MLCRACIESIGCGLLESKLLSLHIAYTKILQMVALTQNLNLRNFQLLAPNLTSVSVKVLKNSWIPEADTNVWINCTEEHAKAVIDIF
jgi:hypothetical protein